MKRFLPLLLLSCASLKKNTAINPPIFDKQGHRGCRGLMPENTVPAMLKAVDLGVTTLEMDISITADSQVILSHDPFLNHEITTKPDGTGVTSQEEKSLRIFQMKYEDILRYDVGLKPHPKFPRQEKLRAVKPLLSEVFDDVQTYLKLRNLKPVFYNIETKTNPQQDGISHPDPAVFVKLLMEVIQEKHMEPYVIIQSFDFRTLQILHRTFPQIKTAALVDDRETLGFEGQLNKLGFNPDYYSPHFNLVTPALIRACHEKNIRILPWTVNEKSKIEELKKMGVDGIISDYPDLF